MKRLNIITLSIALLMAASAVMSGCGSECAHTDANVDGACDACGAAMGIVAGSESETDGNTDTAGDTSTESETARTPAEVNVTLHIKDQYGTAIAGAAIQINNAKIKPIDPVTATTDADGNATVTLTEGEYTVIFEELPEYHLGGSTPLTVTAGMDAVEIEVTNNTPNGSEEHPFFLNTESATFTFAENTTYYFSLFAGDRRSVVIENAGGLTVTLNGTAHTADENGTVRIPLVTDKQQNRMNLAITSPTAQDVTVTVETEPGALDNPIVLTLDAYKTVTATVPKDTVVYYSFTVPADWTGISVHSDDPANNISMTNQTTSATTNFTDGEVEKTFDLAVTGGDVVIIAVSLLDGAADQQSLTFFLTGSVG